MPFKVVRNVRFSDVTSRASFAFTAWCNLEKAPEDPHEQALGTVLDIKSVSIAGVWKTPGEPMKSLVVSALKPDAFNTQRSPGSSRRTRSSKRF
jgi:hypothetical protein